MRTVEKALRLLDYFDDQHPEFGLSELARLSGIDKATVLRMLGDLAATGFADAQSGALAAATLASQGDISADTAVWASAASLGTNTITTCVVAFAAGGWGYGWRFARDIALPSAVVGAGVAFSLR